MKTSRRAFIGVALTAPVVAQVAPSYERANALMALVMHAQASTTAQMAERTRAFALARGRIFVGTPIFPEQWLGRLGGYGA